MRSAQGILSIAMFSIIPQEDSHKNIMFTHFPGLSGACSASASIIGSEAVSPYPFHYVPLYVCVCVHFSQLVYFFFFPSSFAKKATYSVFRSPSVCQMPQQSWPSKSYDISGLAAAGRSVLNPVLTECFFFFFCPLPNNKHCWHQVQVHGFSVIPCS